MHKRFCINQIFYFFIIALSFFGCTGTYKSKYNYNSSYLPNEPLKHEKCYDAGVLLSEPLYDTEHIARQALSVYDAGIVEERDDYIQAKRYYRPGCIVASGGETIVIQFNSVNESETFVTVTTGGASKGWACEMVDQMMKLSQQSKQKK